MMADDEQVPQVAPQEVHDASPAIGWYTDHLLFHRIWERPGLAKRDRSLVTLSALIAEGAFTQAKSHLGIALDNGLSTVELVELATHLAFYAGWPGAMSALNVMREVFADRGLDAASAQPVGRPIAESDAPDDARKVSDLLARVVDPVIHDDLWERPGLTPRDRGLATIAVMIAQSRLENLEEQAEAATGQGLKREELAEAVLHLSFYLGMPRARVAAVELDARAD